VLANSSNLHDPGENINIHRQTADCAIRRATANQAIRPEPMHLHIIGICGTFMGSIALLARQLGHRVSGCDANTYPPMNIQLEECGIAVLDGYLPEHLDGRPELVVVGNTIARGNPVLERALEELARIHI